MKRLQFHITVDNLTESIDFYNKLPGQSPETERPDYAKLLLHEPGLIFAI